jgi:subtilase family protein
MHKSTRRTLAAAVSAAAVLALTQAPAAAATPNAGPLTDAEAEALAQNATTPVIVLLHGDQSPVMSELNQVHAGRLTSYHLFNAVSATVSKAEAARLATDPNVSEVVADSLIHGASPSPSQLASGITAAPAASSGSTVCPAPGKVMLEPEALDVTHTASDDPGAKTARSLGFTGKGVKVGYLAEGVDIDNPDFIRADGSHVFADYQDFTGDGTNATTTGGEAFLDASAIAAQGRTVYNVQNFGAHALPSACDIRIEGVAPGASLYGYKVFGQKAYSTTSGMLAAIQYAVNTDHVDVLNESFGSDPFPDKGSADAIRLADEAAVAHGVTVTVSSGDAGTTGTQGSPSTDPAVISVGASTTFRWLAQTDYAGYQQFAKSGWLNDNVSSLSSSGVNQDGRTIDLLAPGDSSFALCTADANRYQDCTDFNGKPSTVERSGGTSESAPLTAGAAALVIQAYRQSHDGASPSPALVKQIITSTADDLTEPGDEQGAGRLDSYRAVQAALSVRNPSGARGSALLTSASQLDAAGAPGSAGNWRLTVTNTGASAQTVHLSGRDFAAPKGIATGSVTLSDTASQHFADWAGVNNNYGTLAFTVPPGADRLSASIAYPGDPNGSPDARARLILIDPQGRFAAHSLPQGVGNYGNVDVRFPAAGTWTAVIYSRDAKSGGTVGRVLFGASVANTESFGSVSPNTLNLAPGQSGTVTVTAPIPANPGDASGSVVLTAGEFQTSVPIVLRGLVQPTAGGGFSGVLTGGNGRQNDLGQTNYYQFDVPAGRHDVSASVDLANDPQDYVLAYLVDPAGNAVATGVNQLPTAFNPQTRAGATKPITQTDLYARDPRPGRWTLVIDFAGAVAGDELSQPFTGRVGFDTVDVHADLPKGAVLPAGKPVTIPVTVRNTGTAAQDFFLDPRTDGLTTLPLTAINPASDLALPLSASASAPAWLVPSQTNGVVVTAQASLPVTFDFGANQGDPDLPALRTGTTATGAITGWPLTAGVWSAVPAELGAAGANGWPSGTVSMAMSAITNGFDSSVTSTAGDLWQNSVRPSASLPLVTVQPGQTVTIPVTVTPSGPAGAHVSGTLYVDNLVVGSTPVVNALFGDTAPTEPTADELTGIPYQYTVG